MKARRKIIVYVATSADGYIARPDGDVEWLNRQPSTADHGMRSVSARHRGNTSG
jgi:dihydrofolate reductase